MTKKHLDNKDKIVLKIYTEINEVEWEQAN